MHAVCVLGTCNVWHSSRLFCFGRLPAPVLHLFAGPVWCGVNNIQTYTHALISIHSGKQCRTPSLLWGWHLARAKYTWQKISIFIHPIMFMAAPPLRTENSLCFIPKHLLYELIAAHISVCIHLNYITGKQQLHRNGPKSHLNAPQNVSKSLTPRSEDRLCRVDWSAD